MFPALWLTMPVASGPSLGLGGGRVDEAWDFLGFSEGLGMPCVYICGGAVEPGLQSDRPNTCLHWLRTRGVLENREVSRGGLGGRGVGVARPRWVDQDLCRGLCPLRRGAGRAERPRQRHDNVMVAVADVTMEHDDED